MTATQNIDHDTASTQSSLRLLYIAGAGAAVALALGVYSKVHDPTGQTTYRFGFDLMLGMKAWFATVAVVLALWQVTTAGWMWGRLPGAGDAPSWVAPTHRWSGTLAFLFTLPVAYHCLWSLGLQSSDTRVLVHSLLGCAFYGIFATKVIGVRSHSLPGWFLPIIGGATFTLVVGLWVTSSLWFFTNVGFPQF